MGISYGIYDPPNNRGTVCVGTSHDTPAFAAHSIATWWKGEGSRRHGRAPKLLVLADSGAATLAASAAGVQFPVDGVLHATISALEKEIAIEMGDWKTKSQMEVVDGPSIVDILRDRRLRRAHLVEQDAAEEKAAAKAAEPVAKLELEYVPSGGSDQQGVTHVLQPLLSAAPGRQAQFCSDAVMSCDTRLCANFGKPVLSLPPTP